MASNFLILPMRQRGEVAAKPTEGPRGSAETAAVMLKSSARLRRAAPSRLRRTPPSRMGEKMATGADTPLTKTHIPKGGSPNG
jgi:hypothetical protein